MSLAFDQLRPPRAKVEPRSAPIIELGRTGEMRVVAAQAILVVALWLLTRYYGGIVHDSRIYVGRVLANLDPHGLGREPLFALDGQTRFTLYSRLIEPLIRVFGLTPTVMGVTLATVLVWLAAAAWLADRLSSRRLLAASLVCAALAPPGYGPFDIFTYGESLATPRGLAEAGVLAALAALMAGRWVPCGLCLLAAVLLHPPMALCGIGVVFLVLVIERRSWRLLAFAVGAAGVLSAGALFGPLKSISAVMDPAWLAVMRVRNPFLFESAWPSAAWSDATVSMTTVVAAGMLATGRVRSVLLCSAAIALIGIFSAYLLGELTSNALMLQLQFWRALWLVKVLAVLSLPFCVQQLWCAARRDARFSLAALVVAWMCAPSVWVAAPACVVAMASLAWFRSGRIDRLPYRLVVAAGLCAAALALICTTWEAVELCRLIGIAVRTGAPVYPRYVLITGVLTVPVIAIVTARAIRPCASPSRLRTLLLCGSAGLLLVFSLGIWDQRDVTRRMTDLGEGGTELRRLTGDPPAGLVWLSDDVAPWFWSGQATWVNDLQGTVGAFSRPLAMQWDARSRALLASGLGTVLDRDPWADVPQPSRLSPTSERRGVERLCRTPDGPGAVILAGDAQSMFAPGEAVLWEAPEHGLMPSHSSGAFTFQRFDRYTIVRCQGPPPLRPRITFPDRGPAQTRNKA